MSLRTRLLLALSPLLLALAVSVVVGVLTSAALARSSQSIFDENYRSVLAAQRMKEAVERLQDSATFVMLGEAERGARDGDLAARTFEVELHAEEGNITEPNEALASRALRERWLAYQHHFAAFASLTAAQQRGYYFDELSPAFESVKDAAQVILDLNQDAMVRKSSLARRAARDWGRVVVTVGLGGCVLALLASAAWMTRLLRPLSVLGSAARRIGDGDVSARAVIDGPREIAALATDFNAMAARVQKYRESSLGDLLQAQQDLQAAIDSLPDPVLVVSAAGRLKHVNQAAEVALGVHADDTGDWRSAIEPTTRAVIERVQSHILGGKGHYVPKGLEEAHRTKVGNEQRYLLPRASPLYDEEHTVVGATIVFQDVTRLMRVDELRNDLVATVAHELRTPLTSIRMAIHLCAEQHVGPLNEKQADLLFAAKEDCDRLQSIVDDLLDVSRLQQDSPALRMRALPCAEIMTEAVRGRQSEASASGVTVRAEILPGWDAVSVDPERIQIVLGNLLSNAIQHSPPGGTVVVTATPRREWMEFEVRDQGPGVPLGEQEAVFDRYYQSPEGKHGARGLGLAIAKEIVEQHGGVIGVDSAVGSGARFWLRLPTVPGGRIG